MSSSGMLHRVALSRNDIACKKYLLLVIANVSRLLILFTLTMEVINSTETSVRTRATRRHILGDGILVVYINAEINKSRKNSKLLVVQIKHPGPLVRERTTPTERPPLVNEI
jgi:hypothetical protein